MRPWSLGINKDAEFSGGDQGVPAYGAVRHAPLLRWVVNDGRTRNPLQSLLGALVFCNRHTDRLKILYWDRDGWAIWYKRLEAGTFKFPFAETGRKEIAAWELGLLLEGIDLRKGQRRKRYSLPATRTPQESQPIDVAESFLKLSATYLALR